MEEIKFIYFDLGGVVAIDFSGNNKWTEFKRSLGITSEQDRKFDNFWNLYEPQLCIGKDIESLKPLIEKEFNIIIPDSYSLLLDGFVNRFEANESILPAIELACKKYKIGLLTNMYPRMLNAIIDRKIVPEIKWNVIVDSSIVQLQKPEKEIYKIAEKLAGFTGEEIFFIDNTLKNIEVAEIFGWQTFHYDSKNYEISSNQLLEIINNL